MPGLPSQNWSSASDEEVRQHLQEELERVRATTDVHAILGFEDPKDLRKSFLSATKTYHPNRFARRPEDIRALSGELYILLKEAHERAGSEHAEQSLREAKAAAQPSRTRVRRSSGNGDKDSAARKAAAERRRQQLRQKLGNAPTAQEQNRRTAQVRAVSSSEATGSADAAQLEEERFEGAKAALAGKNVAGAASEFKELAVSRPQDKRYRMYMHYAQGLLHLEAGEQDKGRAELKRALGIDSNFDPALEAMSKLGSTEKKKSGLFSKLFGK